MSSCDVKVGMSGGCGELLKACNSSSAGSGRDGESPLGAIRRIASPRVVTGPCRHRRVQRRLRYGSRSYWRGKRQGEMVNIGNEAGEVFRGHIDRFVLAMSTPCRVL